MSNLDDINYLHQLYDTYGNLLTAKQRDNFELYYFEDLSLSEVAQELAISRNAVHNNLQAALQHLKNYEDTLKIVYNKKILNEFIFKVEKSMIVEKKDIENLKKIL